MKNNNKNFRTAFLVFTFFSGMFALAFASVPLYNLFCKVTGYGGTPKEVLQPAIDIRNETIKVRFNTDVSRKEKFYFQPVERQIVTKLGKSNTVDFELINNTDKNLLVTSTYNVTPQKAGIYFNKLDCFCYEEKKVLAGEKVILPVTFFVSAELLDDPNTKELKSITLSYTFFDSGKINISEVK